MKLCVKGYSLQRSRNFNSRLEGRSSRKRAGKGNVITGGDEQGKGWRGKGWIEGVPREAQTKGRGTLLEIEERDLYCRDDRKTTIENYLSLIRMGGEILSCIETSGMRQGTVEYVSEGEKNSGESSGGMERSKD